MGNKYTKSQKNCQYYRSSQLESQKTKKARKTLKTYHQISTPEVGVQFIFTMRPIGNSSSCSTLIDLSPNLNKDGLEQSNDVHDVEFFKTEILLPNDEYVDEYEDEYEDRSEYMIEEVEAINEHLYLPSSATGTSHIPLDVYLRGVPSIMENADNLLAQSPRVLGESKLQTGKERILNVCQGEMAHALPSHCDIIASDDATTCHIVALRSVPSNSQVSYEPMTSLTHIDMAGYEQSIREMFETHQRYHQDHADRSIDTQALIPMDLHIMGGFDDEDESSREISEFLMSLFNKIANEMRNFFRITLRTCAISSINDNGLCCPIGRGLGVELSTGEVFLAEVQPSAVGPAIELRSARGWTQPDDDQSKERIPQLHLIHSAFGPTNGMIVIQPFKFKPFYNMKNLMRLPDALMLQYTSTSPDVEKDNFCHNIRQTLRFMQRENWTTFFGSNCDQPAMYRRDGLNGNKWKHI